MALKICKVVTCILTLSLAHLHVGGATVAAFAALSFGGPRACVLGGPRACLDLSCVPWSFGTDRDRQADM